MKYRLRKVSLSTLGIILLLALSFCICTTSFYMLKSADEKKLDDQEVKTSAKVKNVKKSNKIEEYIKTLPENIKVEETDINNEISSVLITKENGYETHLFDYETGAEKTIEDLIKTDKRIEFDEKIKELIYLKYPTFIADVLVKNDKRTVYYLKENELIIYYYDYEITPTVSEELYLKVNYNEIKDYIDFTVKLDDEYENEDGSVIDLNKKLISITFDDGPSKLTKELVDTLSNNKVNVTFFMVGNRLNSFKDSVLYVHNHGNEIGYHSYAHANFKRENIEDIQKEFTQSNELLKSITGTTFELTRPPYGAINDEIKESLDTSFIMWNVDTEDWRHHDVDYLVDYVLEHISEGDIVLFHDMYRATIDSIKLILPELYVRGYQVVTISELAKANNIELEKHKSYHSFK